jgi:hypothetical protein
LIELVVYSSRLTVFGVSDKKSGDTISTWHKSSSATGAYIDMDTSGANFEKDFAIVTSVAATTAHWRVFGGSSVFQLSRKGFRLYLHDGVMTKWANQHKWGVQFLAFDGPMDCTLSDWGQWGSCHPNSTYHATCVQTRARKITAKATNGGKACKNQLRMLESKTCKQKKCEERHDVPKVHVSTKQNAATAQASPPHDAPNAHASTKQNVPKAHASTKHIRHKANKDHCAGPCTMMLHEICGSLKKLSSCNQCTEGNAADFRAVQCSSACIADYCAGRGLSRRR